MKNKLYKLPLPIVSILFFISTDLNAQTNKIPKGKWINIQDSLYSIVVRKNTIVQFYNGVATDTPTYSISKKPCDDAYQHPGGALFLLLGNLCYEIIGIDSKNMELVYTFNGRTITFTKISQ